MLGESIYINIYPNVTQLRPGGRNRRQQLHQHPETLEATSQVRTLVCGHSPNKSLWKHTFSARSCTNRWRSVCRRRQLFCLNPKSGLLTRIEVTVTHPGDFVPREIEQEACFSFVWPPFLFFFATRVGGFYCVSPGRASLTVTKHLFWKQ